MRPSVQTVPFQFRASSGLLDAARAKAERDGMSLSELMRSALRREIGSAPSATPAISPNGGLGAEVAKLVTDAAKGDLAAQRQLRDPCADVVIHRQPYPNHDIFAAYAVMLARLCAAHGHPEDGEWLAAILLNSAVRFGEWGRGDMADCYGAEALSIYERLALAGNDTASNIVEQIVAMAPSHVVERAKSLAAKEDA